MEHLLDAQVDELGEATRPVGVDVVDAPAALILVDEHEGGAGHLGLYAETPGEALEQAGLARPQGADARDHVALAEAGSQPLAERPGLVGAPRDDPHRGEGVSAAGMHSMRSPATSPSSPRSAAARSPASPWR